MKRLLLLCLMAILPAQAAETMSWFTPPSGQGGFSLIPNETREFFLQQNGYTTPGATFAITGGTILSFRNGTVKVQAPSSGSTCTTTGTTGNPPTFLTVSSVNMVITATAKDGGAAPVVLTVPICTPTVTNHNVPSFRSGIYVGQPIDVQNIFVGNTVKTGVWSITTNPGSHGSLSDTTNRDTVFTSTAIGRYVLTFTATADSSTATTVLDVVAAAPAYKVTADQTMPYACVNDTNLGNVYNIGPSQTYHDFTAFFTAIPTPAAGSQIHLINEDTTGVSPTTVHNYFTLTSQGTQTLPIIICGVPDSTGHLPIIDATNATSIDFNPGDGLQGSYLIQTWFKNNQKYGQSQTYPQFIEFAGMTLQNANDTNTYQITGNGHTQTCQWGEISNTDNTSCVLSAAAFVQAVRIQNGTDFNVIGNRLQFNGQGIFTEARYPEGNMSRWILAEGNYVIGNGKSASPSDGIHQFYLQSYGEVAQFNFIGLADSGTGGGTFKSRGLWEYIRYNYIDADDASSRVLDFVDNQDSCYSAPEQFYNIFCSGNPVSITDPNMNPSILSSYNEARHTENFYYGNTSVGLSQLNFDHFFGDHQTTNEATELRSGTQWFYNNTMYFAPTTTIYATYIYDLNNNDLDIAWEFPGIDSRNSVVWMDGLVHFARPYLAFASTRDALLNTSNTLYSSTCCTNDQINGSDGTGWTIADTSEDPRFFVDYNNVPANISGFGANLASLPSSVASRPFDSTTYLTGSGNTGVALPANEAVLPVRFNFPPTLLYPVPRAVIANGSNTTALVGSVDKLDTLPPTPSTLKFAGKISLSGSITFK